MWGRGMEAGVTEKHTHVFKRTKEVKWEGVYKYVLYKCECGATEWREQL
ncbi:MAG: hypothetical protein ACD_24C00076G0001 [uncultured bacterium]|nr:MAG: hypothetical protein ACD_24C00076G0001 [uncultured bacterium]